MPALARLEHVPHVDAHRSPRSDALHQTASRTDIRSSGQSVQIYSLPALEQSGFPGVSRLPYLRPSLSSRPAKEMGTS